MIQVEISGNFAFINGSAIEFESVLFEYYIASKHHPRRSTFDRST